MTTGPEVDWPTRSQRVLQIAAIGLLVATPLIPSESAAYLGTHVVLVFAWLLLAAAWLARNLLLRMPLGPWDAPDVAVVLLLIVHSASALVMLRAGHPRPTLTSLWQWVSFVVLFLIVRRMLPSRAHERVLAATLIALAAGMAALGFYQIAYSYPQLRAQYARDPQGTLEQAGVHAPPGSPQRRQFEDRLAGTEPTGPFALTNSLAGFLAPPIVLLAALLGQIFRRGPHRWLRAARVAAPLLVLAACLLVTKSRSAYLATLAGLVLLGLAPTTSRPWWRHRWIVAGALVALAVAAGLLTRLGGLDRQVLTEAPKSLLYRLEYWQSTAALIADHPLVGCGPGNFKEFYTRYKLPQASETVSDPHNFLLEVAATAGLPAAILLVAAGWVIVRHTRRARSPTPHIDARSGACRSMDEPEPPCSAVTTATRDGLAGLVIGILLAFPAGWAGGLAPAAATLWVTLPAGVLTLWLLHAWIRDGELTVWPVLCGWASLLVHLLAAGALGYPGLGQMVWLLPALALSVSAPHAAGPDAAAQARADRRPGTRTRIAAVLFAGQLGLLAACYLTMYRPVLDARHYLSDTGGPSGSPRPESVLQAAAADPWTADPWELLVERACRAWILDPTPQRLAAFDQATSRWLDLNRQSSSARRFCGDLSLEMSAATRDPALPARAITFYRQAIERYPQSNLLYAQLAWSYYLVGDITAARHAAETALQLDSRLPHQELKLRNRTLVGQDLAPAPGDGPPELDAEQLMDLIRKIIDDERLNR